jgi:nondiscriminating aspartyl-tRNA synthetase
MIDVFGDSTRDGEWASVRLLVDGDRIVEADAPGLERPLAGLTLLEAAAVGGETLAADALANALGPVFRAEPHDTVRHLAEFVSLDVELGFIRDHHEVIACLRDAIAGMVAAVRERAATAVQRLELTLPDVPDDFPVLHFREALEIAGAPTDEPDLNPAHERALGEWAKAEHGSDFLVVEGYPTAHRAFYSHPDPVDPHWSRAFDLIFRGVELVSGAQRLHRYSDYVRTLEERGYPYEPYASYVEAFRRGIPPHGGFAIGLERWVSRLVEAPNIREVTLFPRDLHRLAP